MDKSFVNDLNRATLQGGLKDSGRVMFSHVLQTLPTLKMMCLSLLHQNPSAGQGRPRVVKGCYGWIIVASKSRGHRAAIAGQMIEVERGDNELTRLAP